MKQLGQFLRAVLVAAPMIMVGMARAGEPESRPIAAIVPDLHHLQKWDDLRGDTADPFWADDDNLYHFTCDGSGFGRQDRNLCFNELTGTNLAQLKGTLVNAMDEYGKADETGPDGATWKITGQECIDGVFYGFVVRNIYGNKSKDPLLRQTSFNASLIKSTDHGRTWTRTARENYAAPMWPGTRFGGPGFFHYGKNGGQVSRDQADQYVYALSNNGFWNGGDDFILGRVRRADIAKLQATNWTYYTSGNGLEDAAWTAVLAKATPILSRPAKLGWTSPVFIPALNRYLLVSWYVSPTLKSWFNPDLVTYDFFEAAHPWGPWNFVSSFDDRFLGEPRRHMYGPNLCAKYQETVGEDVKVDLYTSGCPFEADRTGLYKMWRIPLLVKTKVPPSARLVDINDPAVRYAGNWQTIRISTHRGDAVELEFTGTGVELLADKTHDQGKVDIFLDGQWQAMANLKVDDFPRLAKIHVFRAAGLRPGKHTIRVVNRGSDPVTLSGFSVTGNGQP